MCLYYNAFFALLDQKKSTLVLRSILSTQNRFLSFANIPVSSSTQDYQQKIATIINGHCFIDAKRSKNLPCAANVPCFHLIAMQYSHLLYLSTNVLDYNLLDGSIELNLCVYVQRRNTRSIVVQRMFVNDKNRFCVKRIDCRIYVDWTLFAALAERYKVSYLFF